MHASPLFVARFMALAVLALLAAGCSPEAKKARLAESADRHYAAGDYDRAEVGYLNLMRLDPQNGHAIGRLGLIYTAQGRTGRAIAYLNRGRELSPQDLDVRLRMGQLHLASGKRAEARAEAEHILGLQPQDPEAPMLFAATLASPADAESLRQRLLGLPAPAPTGAPVLTALASLELRLGRLAEAESLIQRAKAADPTFAGLYSVEAAIHVSKRELTAAEEAFKQAAALSPPRSPRHLQYAQFKIRSGDPDTGSKLLQEITTKTPDYVPAWIALAEVTLAQNKLDGPAS
jgi:predicted Zn-dependent protease